jgi:hypothetical protein
LEPISPEKALVEPDSSEIEQDVESQEEMEETKIDQPTTLPATKVLLDVDALKETMEKYRKCPKCNGPMEMSLQTVFMATRIGLSCHNITCGYKSRMTLDDDGVEVLKDILPKIRSAQRNEGRTM